ncbi:MAG: hypothetical protein LIP02_00375 [Bacteroidales bacterium]|nr:hypothetical protein [Bacteroidales bacterium]
MENDTINTQVLQEECTTLQEECTMHQEECTMPQEEGTTLSEENDEPAGNQGKDPRGKHGEQPVETPRSEHQATRVDLEEVLAAAERRGYLKGRNERIEELMARPRELEAPTHESPALILNHIRRSIWD